MAESWPKCNGLQWEKDSLGRSKMGKGLVENLVDRVAEIFAIPWPVLDKPTTHWPGKEDNGLPCPACPGKENYTLGKSAQWLTGQGKKNNGRGHHPIPITAMLWHCGVVIDQSPHSVYISTPSPDPVIGPPRHPVLPSVQKQNRKGFTIAGFFIHTHFAGNRDCKIVCLDNRFSIHVRAKTQIFLCHKWPKEREC